MTAIIVACGFIVWFVLKRLDEGSVSIHVKYTYSKQTSFVLVIKNPVCSWSILDFLHLNPLSTL